MNRCFYAESIRHFLDASENEVLGTLVTENTFDLTDQQRNAWIFEIRFLKNIFKKYSNGDVLFEYSIPRLGKRIDVVLLLRGIVFVLEFKVGAKEYLRQDVEQVWDYALDLKNFHEASRELVIVPILVATEASDSAAKLRFSLYEDHVFEPILCNATGLEDVLAQIALSHGLDADLSRWGMSRYMPTPTIIQAASALYLNHSVEEITRRRRRGRA